MLKVFNVKVSDLKESVIASGNAMRLEPVEYTEEEFQKGLKRMKRLINASKESDVHCHDNALVGINVSFDVIYPQYWTPEFQRYHFADIITSSSKMHRLLKMDVDKACNKYVSQSQIDTLKTDIDRWNSLDQMDWSDIDSWVFTLRNGETLVAKTKDDALYYAWEICLSDCPMGLELFMRVRTNYKQLQTIYYQRKHHKLKEEWQDEFCKNFIEKLPYFKELILGE